MADVHITHMRGACAAGAGTSYLYFPVPAPFQLIGYSWGYQTAEAATDNTFDFVIGRDIDKDGTFDNASDTIMTNGNPNGLLDTAAVGQLVTNKGNAGSDGGAAVAAVPTSTRIAAGETIRVTMITAGTDTVPVVNFAVIGYFLEPFV